MHLTLLFRQVEARAFSKTSGVTPVIQNTECHYSLYSMSWSEAKILKIVAKKTLQACEVMFQADIAQTHKIFPIPLSL